MRQPQSESQSSWSHYAKAAAVFTLTTATYLLARTTGWLPGWFGDEKSPKDSDNISALTMLSAETLTPVITVEGKRNFQLQSSGLADLQITELTDISITEESSHRLEILSTQRHLLQQKNQQSQVMVMNPIPDQVINANQLYSYSLDKVFSDDYMTLDAVEAGERNLPTWLDLQYKLIRSFSIGLGPIQDVTVSSDNIAFLADQSDLLILNVSDFSNPRMLSSFSNFAGIFQSVLVHENIIFATTLFPGRLYILNITNLFAPILLSSYLVTSGGIYNVALNNNTLFLAAYTDGLLILDISNLTKPYLLSHYGGRTQFYLTDVTVIGDIVFIAGGNVGMRILNVSNSSNPQLLSISQGSSVAVSGSTAFVWVFDSGLQILNVTDFTNPILLSTFSYSPQMNIYASEIAVKGDIAFVASVNVLQIVDISDLSNPRLLSLFSSGTDARGNDIYVNGLEVSSNIIFAVAGNNLNILDMSQGNLIGTPSSSLSGQIFSIIVKAYGLNLSSTLAVSSFNIFLDRFPRSVQQTTLADQSLFPGVFLSLSLNSDFLFSNPGNSFLKLNITLRNSRSAPQWLTITSTPTMLNSYFIGFERCDTITLVSNINAALITDNLNGLYILDVQDLQNPYLMATLPIGKNTASRIAIKNNVIFVPDGDAGLQVVDISTLNNPLLQSNYPAGINGYAAGVATDGRAVYLADRNAGLLILNVDNLTRPYLLSSYFTSSVQVEGIEVVDNIAFAADFFAGLVILNVSNLSNVSLLSSFPTGNTVGITVNKNTAFTGSFPRLTILDISNLNSPQSLSSYLTNSFTQNIVVKGTTVFIADYYAGVLILDVKDHKNPFLLGTYFAASTAISDMAVDGNVAFVAAQTGGLQLLDLSQWQLTLSPTTADIGNYLLCLTATDELGGSSCIDFTIRVEGPPLLNGNIPSQQAWVGQPFNYFVPLNLFVDPNDDVISYSANLAGGKKLPGWLQFNPRTTGFGGVPQSSDAGDYTIVLSATDHICPEIPTVNFIISIGFLPVLSHRIPNQLVPIGSPDQFTVPKNSFYDPAGLALSYLAQGVNNQPLPDWLEFNATSLLFFGIANTSDITVYTLQLIATNSAGGQVIASFILRTDHFPVFNKILSLPIASVNQPWVWTLPSDAFTDADGDSLTYSVVQEDGSTLSSWLSFNPVTRTFTGVPLFTGIQGLKITAQDSYGGSNSTYFNLTILSASQSGSVITPPSARAGKSFAFQVNASSIFGSGQTFSYSASLADSSSLPSWLQFISNNLSFIGLPNSSDVGSYDITLIATDSQDTQYNVSFVLNVNPNYSPQIYLPISNQVAQVNEPFVFYVSEQTFVDFNDDNLTYTVNTLPSWLSFDPQQLKFWGIPARSDTDPLTAHVNNIELTAHDDESQTSTLFTISVQGTSNLLLSLQIGVPLLSLLASVWKTYQNRALLLNHCCRKRILKCEVTAVIGEEFQLNLITKPEEVGNIRVKLPKPEETKAARCCTRLFRPCKRIVEESPDHLPLAYPLPKWMGYYTDHNRLFSKGRVPPVNRPQFTVQVLNSAGVIREEVNVTVQAARV